MLTNCLALKKLAKIFYSFCYQIPYTCKIHFIFNMQNKFSFIFAIWSLFKWFLTIFKLLSCLHSESKIENLQQFWPFSLERSWKCGQANVNLTITFAVLPKNNLVSIFMLALFTTRQYTLRVVKHCALLVYSPTLQGEIIG